MAETLTTGRSLDFEAQVAMPIIPFSTSESLNPEEARAVARALERQANSYHVAAAEAEEAAHRVESLGYKVLPRVRQSDKPYNRIWKPLGVTVRGYRDDG